MDKTTVIKITKAEKIRRLVESVDEGNGGVTTAKARLNRKERNFLKKHSDWIAGAFSSGLFVNNEKAFLSRFNTPN